MTAEGTARDGAGEAPRPEFAPEKAAAAAPQEEKAAAEREGEDVGGPFVIVNGGDSDGHSDRGSDLGKAHDEDSPSEEDDVPDSNAAPGAAAAGDHGPDCGEAGAPAAADGGDRAADGPEAGVAEGAELARQQEAAVGEENGGAAALASSETNLAATAVDSEAPAVDSEVEGGAVDGDAVTDVPVAVVQEAASTEQGGEDADEVPCGHDDAVTSANSGSAGTEANTNGEDSNDPGADVVDPVEQGTDGASALVDNGHLCAATEPENQEDAAAESCRHDDALTCTESGSAAIVPEVEDSNERSTADVVEMVEQGTCEADLVTNGHLCTDTLADSFESATEPESHANENKLGHSTTEVTESVEEDFTLRSADSSTLASDSKVHATEMEEQETDQQEEALRSADSCTVASDSKVHATEMEEQETDQQEEAPTSEADVLEGGLKATDRNCAGSVEELIGEVGEEVDAFGHNSVDGSADASTEQEAMVSQVEGEATCGALKLEAAGGVCSSEEIELPVERGTNEVVPDVGESDEVTKNTSQNVQSGLTEDEVSIDTIHSKAPDLSVESSLENKSNPEAVAVNEIAAESDLEAENVVKVETEACEGEEAEVKGPDEANVVPLLIQQDCESALETVDYEKSETPDVDEATEVDNDVEVDLKKDVDAAPLQYAAASAASTLHNEETPNGDCGASLEHGIIVAGEAEITSATGNGYIEKHSDIAVDQGGPIDLNVDEVVADDAEPSSTIEYESGGLDNDVGILKKDEPSEIVGDSNSLEIQSEICNASTKSDECSSRTGNEGSSPVEEIASLVEKTCLSDESCNGINSESEILNASTESSDAVETKCLEALEPSSIGTVVPAEQKGANGQASGELHGDRAQVIGQQRIYIVKIPRFASDDNWAKMEAAKDHLDQLTRERDAINRRKQMQKDVCDKYREMLDAARQVEREARTAHGDKKNDLNSLRSVLGKLHQANSIEDIDELIVKKERTMQHETISLKEEKLLIKEINDLKAQRKQLSSNIGSKAEINEAFDQRDHIHERHKELKKDSDVLFTNLKSLEENTRKIQKSFDEERIALRKLAEEYRVANELRQKAYSEWSELKQEPSKKNKPFFMYRDDRKIAENFRTSGDMYGLKSYCDNQIEKVMEMWNKTEDFRKQYVESNKISTLRRLGTHDGRKLGPDEEPPVIPCRRPINTSSMTASSPEVTTLTKIPAATLAAPASVPVKEDSFPVLQAPQISKRAKSKASGSSAQIESSAVTVSEAEDVKQTEKEKARLMEEQLELDRKAEELARKEEELRKERAAAEKVRLRLEQKAKAKEAEERKRRKAEKDKERAEFKARKEAEEREKKKAKKDKKKGATPADSSVTSDGNAAALATTDTDSNASDNSREVEVPQQAAAKKLSRPAAAIKQLNRVQPMPAPLRNRGRRKMRQYILIAAAVLSVVALFVAGNYIPRLKSVHS